MNPEALHVLGPVAAFVLGACVGSFLNVCTYRIPLNRSVVSPGSHCAACGAPIPWYRNIPVLSWLVLRGRAACCGTRIDGRYAVVELGTGLVFLALWLRFGVRDQDPLTAVLYAVMTAGLIVACLIDLDHFIIPDRFTLGGCIAGFVACAIDPRLMGEATRLQGFTWSLASAMAGALVLLAVGWIGTLIFRKEAMGMGDVKFLAAICSFLGVTSLIWTITVSSAVGAVLGVALILWQRGAWGTRIPYGPFLGLAAVGWLFGGADITHAWLQTVQHNWGVAHSPEVVNPLPSGR
jgi:leader peptidase (prepilin peptidase)/N-methyltransferase